MQINPAFLAAAINANVRRFWDGRQSGAEFAARQNALWAEAEGAGCVPAVAALLGPAKRPTQAEFAQLWGHIGP